MFDIPIWIYPLAAFSIGLGTVPAIRRIALATGFLDNPDRQRKLHRSPTALGGGIAVWLATWLGFAVSLFGSSSAVRDGSGGRWFLPSLALASFLILCVGAFDDRNGMRGRHKLAWQVLCAVTLVALGLRIEAWSCFGIEIQLGVFAYPITVLWVLLVVNAFNLIDGLDGFCASLGVVASLAIAFLASWQGQTQVAIVGLALSGALAAFLKYNLPPAKIYLGDAGSMTIGLIISALALRSCSSGQGNSVSLLPMVALLLLPLFDLVTAVGRRWLKGWSIFVPDRGHLHHCLNNRLGSSAAAVGVAVVLAAIGAIGATLALAYETSDHVPTFAIGICIGLLVGTNTFGANESRLLLFRLKVALKSLSPSASAVIGRDTGQECHLSGRHDWAGLWDVLVREGMASGVWRIELAIDMASTGEVYHGHWSLPVHSNEEPHWSIVHNLYAGEVRAGTISIAGNSDATGLPYLDKVERLVRVVKARLIFDGAHVPSPGAGPLATANLKVESAVT
jgi:UDP-GlcNAc:undecaprenyl-phosphate GlcNAc-1-phosphate transferase